MGHWILIRHPKIEPPKMLFHVGYWDGPLSGLCLVDGTKCWFAMSEEYDGPHPETEQERDDFTPPWYRRFLVWRLSAEELAEVERRHEKFRRMVGTHCDYTEDGLRGRFALGGEITQATVDRYYAESKLEPVQNLKPADGSIVGWFED